MQDRLNFRFWDTKERIMLDWDCICQTAFNCTREEGNEIQRYGLMYFVFTTLQRFIPLQCTGLRDKNGKLIFEGDIVERKGFNPAIKRGVVIWDKENLCFKVKNMSLYSLKNRSKIIGNIYENPQLLEEQKC